MFAVLSDINWLAIIVSTIVFAVLGGLYFSVIVPKPYKVALGNENKDLPKPGPIFIAGPLISSLVVVITSAILLRALSVESLGDGIVFGLIVGIGYLVAQTLNIAINPNFPGRSSTHSSTRRTSSCARSPPASSSPSGADRPGTPERLRLTLREERRCSSG